ncbi:MAG: hypothetical protein ACP5OO_05025 [Chloroflexia bacterium]
MAALFLEWLEPYRRIREEMAGREEELWDLLRQGGRWASALARATLEEVRTRMGLPQLRREEAGLPGPSHFLDLTGKRCG